MTWQFTVTNPAATTLRATLVWMDPPNQVMASKQVGVSHVHCFFYLCLSTPGA